MTKLLKKEWLCLLLVAAPFVYLGSIWNRLPDQVPLHWNLQGEVDRWGSRSEMWLIPVFTVLLTYLLLTVIPNIDPKKRIAEMGVVYGGLKLILVGVMSALALVIIHMCGIEKMTSPVLVLFIVGLLFAVLGGFMKSIKPNYFIGIRTPWTLESPEVWQKTHKLGGVLFMLGGATIAALAVLASIEVAFRLTIVIGVGIALISVVYSYLVYRRIG